MNKNLKKKQLLSNVPMRKKQLLSTVPMEEETTVVNCYNEEEETTFKEELTFEAVKNGTIDNTFSYTITCEENFYPS